MNWLVQILKALMEVIADEFVKLLSAPDVVKEATPTVLDRITPAPTDDDLIRKYGGL